jgi:hypothetical protein
VHRFGLRFERRLKEVTFPAGERLVRTQNVLGLQQMLKAIAPVANLTGNIAGTAVPKVQATPPPLHLR